MKFNTNNNDSDEIDIQWLTLYRMWHSFVFYVFFWSNFQLHLTTVLLRLLVICFATVLIHFWCHWYAYSNGEELFSLEWIFCFSLLRLFSIAQIECATLQHKLQHADAFVKANDDKKMSSTWIFKRKKKTHLVCEIEQHNRNCWAHITEKGKDNVSGFFCFHSYSFECFFVPCCRSATSYIKMRNWERIKKKNDERKLISIMLWLVRMRLWRIFMCCERTRSLSPNGFVLNMRTKKKLHWQTSVRSLVILLLAFLCSISLRQHCFGHASIAHSLCDGILHCMQLHTHTHTQTFILIKYFIRRDM